jgi:RHS repeat-associated protein
MATNPKRAALGLVLALASAPAFALSVSLTAPANGAVFQAGATVTLTATATPTNPNRPITKVEFFSGGTTLIGTDTTSPYSFDWTSVPAGSYSITAKATDSTGATATSTAVTIKVNAPPAVTLTSPANGTLFAPGSTITLAASASDSDGTIAKVEFLQGTTVLNTDTTSPYSFDWTNVPASRYALTARATDNDGGVTTSAAVNISVDTPPTVSITVPANGAVFLPGTPITITADVTPGSSSIWRVLFFDGGVEFNGAPAPPYSVVVSNPTTGNHSYTVQAIDSFGGAGVSAPVNVRVDAAPTVSITSPAGGATFNAPASITVAANAADADGTVAKVDFFDGATLVGTSTAAPYSVALTNVAAGTHSYTARATDNDSAVTTSAAVSVSVNAPPAVSITAPANNAVFGAPATITVTASASDADGTVAKVDFFQGATLIGTATAAPYSATAANLTSGSYSFTAVATDNSGAATTSAAVAVRVNAAPTVAITAPASGATYSAPAAIAIAATATDTDGTIASVAFYHDGVLITTVSAAPYSITWTGVPQGSYVLSAVATDDLGAATTSATVPVTVGPHVAQMYFIHPDHLNTPRAVSDTSGTVVWKWDQTEPFGDSVPNGDPNNTGNVFDFPLGLSLYYADKETGQRYAQRRDCYDPVTGRFCQSDPIGLMGGINTYLYVDGNPLSGTDLLGLMGFGGGGSAAHPQPNACPPGDCPDPITITITSNGVCRDGDTLCAQAMQAAGLAPPYFGQTKTATYSLPCLVSFGLYVKGTMFAAGTAAQKYGPRVLTKMAGQTVGNVAARVAAVAGSAPVVAVSGALSIIAILNHCECKSNNQ